MLWLDEQKRHPIGRILLDGGFLSDRDLERALEEQRHTNELIGQVLIRMGVIDPADLKAALSIQGHLDHPGDAVRIAAGTRRMLGELLLQAGHITADQLEHALAEQNKTGEKLGETLIRLGLLTHKQLDVILDFQQKQADGKGPLSPLRLGELLITAGHITRDQLDDALYKQKLSQKRLGEILVEEGYAHPHHIKHGLRLQHMLLAAAMAFMLTACGNVNDNMATQSAAEDIEISSVAQKESDANKFTITKDDYGLLAPNFYYSTNNSVFWSIQANIAKDLYDPDFKCIIRIDILKENGVMPDINKTFSIEDNGQHEKFPGNIFVFNGQESTNKKVERGIISFTQDSTASGNATGSFDIIMTDYDSAAVPAPSYRLMGSFNFMMETYGAASSSPATASSPK